MIERGRPRKRRGPRGRFAHALRAARAARELTQEQAARALGVDRATLAKWETGSQRPRGPVLHWVEAWIRGDVRGVDDGA